MSERVRIFRFEPGGGGGGGGWNSPGDDDGYGGGRVDPWAKLKFIVGLLILLWLADQMLAGPGQMANSVSQWLVRIPALLIALTLHEFGHAAMADFLGDPTARKLGRKTLNPLAHLDVVGTILLMFANFGWAKPVPVDPRNFRLPLRAMVAVAAAGPLMNIFLAVLSAVVLRLILPDLRHLGPFGLADVSLSPLVLWTARFCFLSMVMNISLAIFNLIPLPPLDGSKIVEPLLKPSQRFWMNMNAGFCQLILLVLLGLGVVSAVIGPIQLAGMNQLLEWFGVDPLGLRLILKGWLF